jgi:hypothetical protein
LSLALEEEGERERKGNQERGKEGEGGGWKVMSIFTARKINKTSVFAQKGVGQKYLGSNGHKLDPKLIW